jgi:hypothetical protein
MLKNAVMSPVEVEIVHRTQTERSFFFRLRRAFVGVAGFLVFCASHPCFAMERPRLIVLLVIDQFRADYLTRFESRFLPPLQKDGRLGGFRYLMTQGAYYPLGRYDVLESVTAVGHMTVSTGSYPYQSGIVANSWFDSAAKKEVYCTEDSQSPLLEDDSSDPEDGRSPKRLIGTTLGDQLKISNGSSRVIGIAIKDRASILMAGHTADLALWLNRKTGQWTTSSYYLPSKKLPQWVVQLNQKSKKFLKRDEKLELSEIIASPAGNLMTAEAVEMALSSLKLGRGPATDLLAISLSSHDAAGHRYGPNSREMEEMTLSDDQTISRLLNSIKKATPGGLSRVTIVLTADHGVAPNEEWSRSIRLPFGKLNTAEIKNHLNHYLEAKLGKLAAEHYVAEELGFEFYLNLAGIREKGVELARVESLAKDYLKGISGVAQIFSSTDYSSKNLPPGRFEQQILHSYFPGRSGDLVIIPKPFVTPVLDTPKATTHITGYSYDRTVPIILSGKYIKTGTYAHASEVIDIAPTLAFLAGVIAPSSSEGRVLSEILTDIH